MQDSGGSVDTLQSKRKHRSHGENSGKKDDDNENMPESELAYQGERILPRVSRKIGETQSNRIRFARSAMQRKKRK